MRKIEVKGPTIYKILETFKLSINYGLSLPTISVISKKLKDRTIFKIVINSIDASIWNLPPSVFNNEPTLKKILIVHGWISHEKNKKLSSTVKRNCKLHIKTDGQITLILKRRK